MAEQNNQAERAELSEAEIAGIMGWRGPGAYTAATLRKIREVLAADRRKQAAPQAEQESAGATQNCRCSEKVQVLQVRNAGQDIEASGERQSIDTEEFRELLSNYAVAISRIQAEEIRKAFAALIAYIDGRTAGAADEWQPIATAPHDKMLLLAAEFDRPGDWRIKAGGHWDGKWNVFGATWTPTRWQHLPAAPSHQSPGKEGA